MKKRFLALIFAGIMLSGTVLAEETEEVSEAAADEMIEVTMDMIEEAAYEGSWVSFQGGFDLYLPGSWDVFEILEEEEEAGLIFQAADPGEPGNRIIVMANEAGDDYTLETILQELQEIEYTNTGIAVFNSIQAVHYETDAAAGLTFLDDAGNLYNIQIAIADETYEPIRENIFYSLSPTEMMETVMTEE